MNDERIQININVHAEDARMLDRMMAEDMIDNRSMFIRRLIRQEWARRYSQPNPRVTVEQAVKARKAIAVK
jgi:metal-responsive CopG/Arc/MetJ family transcriptional regulator